MPGEAGVSLDTWLLAGATVLSALAAVMAAAVFQRGHAEREQTGHRMTKLENGLAEGMQVLREHIARGDDRIWEYIREQDQRSADFREKILSDMVTKADFVRFENRIELLLSSTLGRGQAVGGRSSQ